MFHVKRQTLKVGIRRNFPVYREIAAPKETSALEGRKLPAARAPHLRNNALQSEDLEFLSAGSPESPQSPRYARYNSRRSH